MNDLNGSLVFSVILLTTILGEFVFPWILKHFYKGYNSKTMVMSVLGSPESPVRIIYNIWLVWLGAFLLFTSILLFEVINAVSSILAILTLISISAFAIGAGILSGLFSVNESKEKLLRLQKFMAQVPHWVLWHCCFFRYYGGFFHSGAAILYRARFV